MLTLSLWPHETWKYKCVKNINKIMDLLLLSLLCSEDTDNKFLFFDQEGSHDSFTHTFGTTGSTISSRHCLLCSWECCQHLWSYRFHSTKFFFTITTFGCSTCFLCVQIDELASRCLGDSSTVRFGVVWESATKYQTSHCAAVLNVSLMLKSNQIYNLKMVILVLCTGQVSMTHVPSMNV